MAVDMIKPLSQAEEEAILQFYRSRIQQSNSQWDTRTKLENIDKFYMREVDKTLENYKANRANNTGDSDKIQNITVPIVLSQVETAVTYQSSVFLTGVPIFSAVAPPPFAKEAEELDSIIYEQSVVGGWTRELLMFFRDGFKYNLSYLEIEWEKKTVASFDTDIAASAKEAKVTDIVWEGNKIRRLSPYNTFFDVRVNPAELHTRGEYAGYIEIVSRMELMQFIIDKNIVRNKQQALMSKPMGDQSLMGYYQPEINPDAFIDNYQRYNAGETNWMAFVGGLSYNKKAINYSDYYEKTVLYARIIPADLGIKSGNANTPQIWKFTIINGKIVILAERMNNAHGYLPIICGQPLEDGLGFQTKSLAQNAKDMQSVSSALMNSVLASRRRAITDRVLYNPSLIEARHINSPNPSAKIPVRPAAYGRSLAEAVYPFPFRDDQAGITISEIDKIAQMSNMLAGQNPARQGQFVKGNKTLSEYESVMANANGRDQVISMLYEAQVFTPLKHIIKSNILQYQGPKFLYNPNTEATVQVDPVKLRKAVMSFKISDGLSPNSKILNLEQFNAAFNLLMQAPNLAQGYNLVPMFTYLMSSSGAKLSPFEKSPEQQAYEQALASWQNTMATIAEALKNADPAMQQDLMSKLPPQPTPEQFNYKVNNKETPNG
jgi:hypothetical protein